MNRAVAVGLGRRDRGEPTSFTSLNVRVRREETLEEDRPEWRVNRETAAESCDRHGSENGANAVGGGQVRDRAPDAGRRRHIERVGAKRRRQRELIRRCRAPRRDPVNLRSHRDPASDAAARCPAALRRWEVISRTSCAVPRRQLR